MRIEFTLEGDAEQAFNRVLETVSKQAGKEIPPEEIAETVLREHIADQYASLVVQGDPTQRPEGAKTPVRADQS